MIRLFAFVAALSVGVSAFAAVNTEYLQGLGDTRYHAVASESVARDYHVFVMLPAGYENTAPARYPVVYLLDGGALYPLLVAYYRYLHFAGEVPALVIVGISYGNDDYGKGNFRSTDYTAPSAEREYWGGAPLFQEFLRHELLPFVENEYRVRADRRIIFGQSLGGQFVLYTGLTDPGLFWGHIASNPALHRNLPFFLGSAGELPAGRTRPHLFVASAVDDNPRFREPALAWIAHWSAEINRPWHLKTLDLPGHGHMSAPPAAFRAGLRWLFRDTAEPSP